jgi:hypothetical protein
MESIRAKMRVGSVVKRFTQADFRNPDAGTVAGMEIELYAVGAEENKAWNTATPSGKLTLTVNNQDCFPFIEAMPCHEFFIDITPADKG